MDKIKSLLLDGLINQFDYDAFILFEANELGRTYLKNVIESVFLDEPENFSIDSTYAWHDGRRSVWREIKLSINKVNRLLGVIQNERSKPKRKRTTSSPGDPTGIDYGSDSI